MGPGLAQIGLKFCDLVTQLTGLLISSHAAHGHGLGVAQQLAHFFNARCGNQGTFLGRLLHSADRCVPHNVALPSVTDLPLRVPIANVLKPILP
eukprot:7686861-Lingulodinium_polyedra.AAC.1